LTWRMRTGTFAAMSQIESAAAADASWEFAGWGQSSRIDDLDTSNVEISRLDQAHKHTLGTLPSTAICGNDITSSCLYVSALCAAQAGAYAPIVLGVVVAVLYLFRKVYAEVGSALPLNGGTYTVLLNTTNKKLAAAAACLTLLSYVATAVISAGEAMHYAHNLYAGLNIFWATIGLLGFFAILNLVGISESAAVAVVIFLFHMLTLSVLVVVGSYAVIKSPALLSANWQTPSPEGLMHALFFGFAAAMLGISGFESSANFIEEQKEGVFPKTLRNMWMAVAIFNPWISLLALGLLPLAHIQSVPPDLLAEMGTTAVGPWLGMWISIDAVLVLSGAVLTSFVGVTGLMRRMSLDRCLPQVLLRENKSRKTNHYIIIAFFLISVSILYATAGEVGKLAGVYTISFLSVMALFAIGNMLLKVKRGRLPRAVKASWPAVVVALAAVLLGLAGNVMLDFGNLVLFLKYFLASVAVVGAMFLRIQIMKAALFVSRAIAERLDRLSDAVYGAIRRKIDQINSRVVVYFAKGDDPAEVNRAALYVMENEQTSHMKIVHVYREGEEPPPQLADHLREIDRLYPNLRMDFVAVKGEFTPALIELLAERLDVPKNYMFIGTPGNEFPHRIEALGGVRLIL